MKDMKLTSVKLLKTLYEDFKLATINTNTTLQKVTNRSIYLYLNNDKFRDLVNTSQHLTISSSNL
jgi:hypothetical protein